MGGMGSVPPSIHFFSLLKVLTSLCSFILHARILRSGIS